MKSTYSYSHVIYHKPKIPPVLKLCFKFSDLNRGDTEQFQKILLFYEKFIKTCFYHKQNNFKMSKNVQNAKDPLLK